MPLRGTTTDENERAVQSGGLFSDQFELLHHDIGREAQIPGDI